MVLTLDELKNHVKVENYEAFAPALDYIVEKMPRGQFHTAEPPNRNLGTQMKATGEVMALGRTFEEAILKAVRSLETGHVHIEMKHAEDLTDSWIERRIKKAGDERLFFIGEALRRGVTVEKIHEWSLD